MAVVSCTELEAEGGIDENGQRTWTVTYQVITDDAQDGAVVAIAANGIPGYFAPYTFGNEYDYGAYRGACRAKLKSWDTNRKDWRVTATFSSKPLDKPPDESRTNDPLLLPPEINGDFLHYQEPLIVDKDGAQVANSAGDLFEDLVRDRSHRTLTIAKNFGTSKIIEDLDDYIDTVNSATFFGKGARYWKLTRAPWKEQYRGSGTPYYRVTFEFVCNKATWDYKPADSGWFYVDGSDNKLQFTDKHGLPLNKKGYLDGAGGKLPDGDSIIYFDGQGGNPGPISAYEEKNFADLGIPTNYGQR